MTEESQEQPMITAVMPTCSEVKTIAKVFEGSRKHVNEVLVVDDGSPGSASDSAKSGHANVIQVLGNTGKGNTLSIGLTTVQMNRGETMVCLDGNRQHDARSIPSTAQRIPDAIEDMVIGSKSLRTASIKLIPVYRRLDQSVLAYEKSLENTVKIADSQNGWKAFKRHGLKHFDYAKAGRGIESEMARSAARMVLRIEEIQITALH